MNGNIERRQFAFFFGRWQLDQARQQEDDDGSAKRSRVPNDAPDGGHENGETKAYDDDHAVDGVDLLVAHDGIPGHQQQSLAPQDEHYKWKDSEQLE